MNAPSAFGFLAWELQYLGPDEEYVAQDRSIANVDNWPGTVLGRNCVRDSNRDISAVHRTCPLIPLRTAANGP